MRRSARHGGWALAILSLVATGCHKDEAPVLPVWSSPQALYSPRPGSGNGFDSLALAAQNAERSVNKDYLDRVYWTPARREAAIRQASSSMATVAAGVSRRVDFEFTSREPFMPSPYARGWRVLGRTIVWRAEEQCAKDNFDAAIRDAILATKFGMSLTGGDAMDASLGFATADDARRAIAPHLQKMGAGQLQSLANGLERALASRPALTDTFDHEKENMLRAVQYVQDSFARNDFSTLKQRLGPGVRDAITYLKDLRDESATKQAAYFQGFAAEAAERARWLKAISELPLEQRERDPGPRMEDPRPWRGFARHFFGSGEPLLSMRDATLARTRLMILECRVLALVKSGRLAPPDLNSFAKETRTDPYTGRELMFKASGSEFTLYSVGENTMDDGGDTDQSFSAPDLTIEREAK